MPPPVRAFILATLVTIIPGVDTLGQDSRPRPTGRPMPSRIDTRSVLFEPNVGQFDEGVRFLVRAGASHLFLTDEGVTLELLAGGESSVVRMKPRGGRAVSPRGSDALFTKTNYFLGDDPSRWHTDVTTFGRVTYASILDGVDLVFHGVNGSPEYDFVVAPGGDPSQLAMDIEGADGVSITGDGELAIRTAHGTLVQPRPRVYQRDIDGQHDVRGAYRIVDAHAVGFAIAAYDRARELVIDPILISSSYLGNGGAGGIGVDGKGDIYLAGSATSPTFPTKNPIYPTSSGMRDSFVLKMDASQGFIVYATYVGGTKDDQGFAIAVDSGGSAYIAGQTMSSNFPTKNPFQATGYGGDGFVTKINPAGSALVYSTYLGGTGGTVDAIGAIAVNAAGEVFVTGETGSADFPTKNPIQAAFASVVGEPDAFVAKFDAPGTSLVYSTYLGGSRFERPSGIAIDPSGNAFVAGQTTSLDFPTANAFQPTRGPALQSGTGGSDAFVTKVNPSGTAYVFSTYLGGTGGDQANGIAADATGNAYVVGHTTAKDFPVTNPIQGPGTSATAHLFLAKFDGASGVPVYSTCLYGDENWDYLGTGVVVDAVGNATFIGTTNSNTFPMVNPLQPAPITNGTKKIVIGKVSPSGSALVYSTYLGGSGSDTADGAPYYGNPIAMDPRRSVYVFGRTTSSDFPTRTNQGGTPVSLTGNMFIAKLAQVLATPVEGHYPPRAYRAISGSGDHGPWTYAFLSNASGGTLNAVTGDYYAGATPSVTDVIEVTDAEGASALARIVVGPGVSITPSHTTVSPTSMLTLKAGGGDGAGYAFVLTINGSGGSVGAVTGDYASGPTVGTDVVTATDALGNMGAATIEVKLGAVDGGVADGGPADAGPDSPGANGTLPDAEPADGAQRPIGERGVDAGASPDRSESHDGCATSPRPPDLATLVVTLLGMLALRRSRRNRETRDSRGAIPRRFPTTVAAGANGVTHAHLVRRHQAGDALNRS